MYNYYSHYYKFKAYILGVTSTIHFVLLRALLHVVQTIYESKDVCGITKKLGSKSIA